MWIDLPEELKDSRVGVLQVSGQETIKVKTTDNQLLTTGPITSVDQYNAWKQHARWCVYVDGELVPVNSQAKYWQA